MEMLKKQRAAPHDFLTRDDFFLSEILGSEVYGREEDEIRDGYIAKTNGREKEEREEGS